MSYDPLVAITLLQQALPRQATKELQMKVETKFSKEWNQNVISSTAENNSVEAHKIQGHQPL